ncbi:hypothetical protein NQZ79_g646 [Umbelopsis isabellina]|nr:hypothetical protein NQZ79_g646 [Umbelopsis isabellina]
MFKTRTVTLNSTITWNSPLPLVQDTGMKSPSVEDEATADDLAEIEEKKQELRSMVGEQYRDLISAADAIVSMKKAANAVQSKFDFMKTACDINVISQKTANAKSGDEGTVNDQRRYLYVSAAQMKLLVDVPEQIWHALESDQYLEASRLYLLAKMVYKNLLVEEGVPFVVVDTFPVVQKQWDAISQFKNHILQRAESYLKNTTCSAQLVAESLLSLMLLDDVTTKDGFRKLLNMRTAALQTVLESSKSKIANYRSPRSHIIQQLHDATRLVKGVIIQVYSIYVLQLTHAGLNPAALQNMTNDTTLNNNLISTYVRQLQTSFCLQTIDRAEHKHTRDLDIASPATCTQPAISRIYSPNTNVHLLVRYLPESIQKYTPYINIHGSDGEGMLLGLIREELDHWLSMAGELMSKQMSKLLSDCPDIKTLLDIRSAVWEIQLEDELAAKNSSKSLDDGHIWSIACHALFGNPVSLWYTILKSPFKQQLESLINNRSMSIRNQAQNLSDYLSASSRDYNAGKYFHSFWELNLSAHIWSSQTKSKEHGKRSDAQATAGFVLPAMASTVDIIQFKQKVKRCASCYTPACQKMQEAFDQAVRNALDDYQIIGAALDSFMDQTDITTSQASELFSSTQDTHTYLKYHHEQCIGAIADYLGQISHLLDTLQRDAKAEGGENASDGKAIFLGRLTRGIALTSTDLLDAFTHTAPNNGVQYTTALPSHADRVQAYLETQSRFIQLYHKANEIWSTRCITKFEHQMLHLLKTERWDDMNASAVLWQTVSGTEDNESLKLPGQATNAIIDALLEVCKEIHRAHSGTLDEPSLNSLCNSLLSATGSVYKTFLESLKEAADVSVSMTEKGALQMLYDLQFLSKLLQVDTEVHSLKDVISSVKSKIDAINMRVFQTHITSNVERSCSKYAIMLGLLFTTARRPQAITRKHASSSSEQPNTLPAAEQIPRFALLPIGHQPSSLMQRY